MPPVSDDDRPGWGILATGGIAGRFTADLRTAGLRVAAVGSRTEDRARAFADEHGVPHAHGSWEALVADPDVDVVYVATPHPAHREAALVAIEHGKHVLIEKPFALNEAEAADVLGRAEVEGVVALEAMWTRWLPHMLEVHDVLGAGTIGEPQVLIVDHTQAISDDPAHRLNDPELGGGALLDLGVYPISFAHDLFGEPVDLEFAATWTPTGVDQRVSATLVHEREQHTVVTTASNLRGPNRASIVGTGGSIEIDPVWYRPTGDTGRAREGAVVRRSEPEVAGRGMQYQALEVERLLAEGRRESERLTSADTLAVMRTMDRIRAGMGLVYPQESAGA